MTTDRRRARSSTRSSRTISVSASRRTGSSTSPTRSPASPASASTRTSSARRSAPRSGSSRTSMPSIDDLGLPTVLPRLRQASRAASSSSPARPARASRPRSPAIIDEINRTREEHILTIEDPIEFLHKHKKCIVNQREIGSDAQSFASALKGALRQDPDVILVGEMRDLETIHTALTAAETGHLVFATLHTQDTPQTIDRIIDVFPPEQQQQVRVQLSVALQGIVTQQLLPTLDGSGRIAACEVLVADPRDPQPDPRGQDPPDLLVAADRREHRACRRWTPPWRSSCAPARSARSSPRAARPPPRSCAACWAWRCTRRNGHEQHVRLQGHRPRRCPEQGGGRRGLQAGGRRPAEVPRPHRPRHRREARLQGDQAPVGQPGQVRRSDDHDPAALDDGVERHDDPPRPVRARGADRERARSRRPSSSSARTSRPACR